MHRRTFLLTAGSLLGAAALGLPALHAGDDAAEAGGRLHLSDAEWRRRLGPARYRILRQAGTEPPGSSPLDAEHRAGLYRCAGCELPLFASRTKFHSGTGWPSFWAPLKGAVRTRRDLSLMMVRTEVRCRRCDGHLGHVFDDGPPPTGLRYCINGLALHFVPDSGTA